MHILIIPSWYPNDPEDPRGSFFREQALALYNHGCTVGVIHPQHRSLRQWPSITSGKYGIQMDLDHGVPTYRLHGMNWFPKMRHVARHIWIAHGFKLFIEYIRRHGCPDVIHAHSILNAGILASKIACTYSIPYVLTEHSTAYARGLVVKQDLRLAEKIVSRASKCFAVSNEFCALLDKTFESTGKWIYLPNIVSGKFIESALELKRPGYFRFINVAFAEQKKCQQNIIRAFACSFKDELNVRLLIGGDGPELQSLKRLAIDLGVDSRVEFPGLLSRHQVLETMKESHAFVLSSQYETFGVVVIEALALGLPVIATRCGGPESILREQDGILIPVNDVTSLANAMQELYINIDKYSPSDIKKKCAERFGEKVVVDRLMAIYHDVCGNNNDKEPCN